MLIILKITIEYITIILLHALTNQFLAHHFDVRKIAVWLVASMFATAQETFTSFFYRKFNRLKTGPFMFTITERLYNEIEENN